MEPRNPYSPPESRVADMPKPASNVPPKILRKIKRAWVAALVLAGMTLIFTLIAIKSLIAIQSSGARISIFSAGALIDTALILGLAFGIYKKSRVCAVLMFIYFVISKILMWETIIKFNVPSIPLALLFGYFFWQGVWGTFAYHKLIQRARLETGSPNQKQ
jgi:serine/threonine-protein kinase